jgi:predicted nucleic acid-binding protein
LKIVVDSWAWVEILKLSEAGAEAKRLVEEADGAFTPSIVLAELARKYLREEVDPEVLEATLLGISEATEVVPIDIPLCVGAAQAAKELSAKARRERVEKPGLGDALVLATARGAGAKVLTGDRHFKGLDETIWLGAGPR